jgi:hypothetical protein
VLAQTYPSIEYRVLDGGSTDNTHEVLRGFGDRVQWEVEPDTGQSNCINRGWRAAKGEILAWLCADDLLEPNAVATAVAALDAHPNAAAVYGGAVEMFPDGTESAQPPTPPFNLWRLINVQDFIYQPAAFFRRDAVAEVGWLNEDLHYCMDWDLFIRLGQRHPIVPIQDRLSRVRMYADTKTSGGGVRRLRELSRVIRDRSDSRFPPALTYYALETGLYRGHQLVDKLPLSTRVARRAHSIVHRAYGRAMRITGRRIATQWLEDGWAGPSARFVVPAGDAQLRGEVPADLAPLSLTITSEGRQVASHALAAGPFEMTIPARSENGAATHFVVHADRSKPVWHPLVGGRVGSYRLDTVEVGS